MDRNFIIAMLLMVAVLFAWQTFFAPAPKPPQDLTPTGEQAAPASPTPAAAPAAAPAATQTPPPLPAPPAAPIAAGEIVAGENGEPIAPPPPPTIEPVQEKLAFPLVHGVLANRDGGSLLDWELLSFNDATADQKKPAGERKKVDLAPFERPMVKKKLKPRVYADQPQLVCALNDMAGLDGTGLWRVETQAPDQWVLRQSSGALTVTKTLRFSNKGAQPQDLPYNIDIEMQIANASNQPVTVQPFCAVYEQIVEDTSTFFYRDYNQMLQVNNIEGSLKGTHISKVKPDDVADAPTFWTGFSDNYFAMLIGPDQETLAVQNARAKIRDVGQGIMESRLLGGALILNANESKKVVFKAYLGPKQREFIAAGNNGPKYRFDRSIDFGWFDIIARYLMVALIYLARLTGNYGIAILILTVVIKILMFPLQHKSFKSMKQMQRLQPEIAKLREKYKDNKEKINQEMMALYRAHNVNPAGGCLPMLLQLPIFIAFYRALGYSIELRHTPFFGWLQDLSAQDPYYVTPILMGVTMFISQKMTPSTADPAQARIMMMMPILFTFLFLSFPSGLVLYWLTNNILSIAQQVITNKYFSNDPLPAPAKLEEKIKMSDEQENRFEFTGKTVEEAVAAAAQNFGVDKDLLEVEILSQPGSLTALFGRKVRISARPKNDPIQESLKFVHHRPAGGNGFDPESALLRIAATILPEAVVEAREDDDHLVLDIKGDGSGIFIGRKGSTLEAIQFLLSLMAQKQGWEGKRILVDSEHYHERRIDAVRDKCRQLAERALSSGRPQSTEMLDAAMRKVVHGEIKNFGELRTKSIGNGDLKRVQIFGNNNHAPRERGRERDRDRR